MPEAATHERPPQTTPPRPPEGNAPPGTKEPLPIEGAKAELHRAIRDKDRTIVVGATGSGKTTVLPEIILAAVRETNPQARILVTQPRRLAVRSNSEQIGKRMGADNVGYRMRGESTATKDTPVTVTVDGSLLRMLQNDTLLSDFDAVMVDEVHEGSIDIHLELALLKKAQAERKRLGIRPLKIIVASATLDKEKLTKYLDGAALFDIPGRLHHIDDHFETEEIRDEDLVRKGADKIVSIILNKSKTGDLLSFWAGKGEIDGVILELENRMGKGVGGKNNPNYSPEFAQIAAEQQIDVIPLLGGDQQDAATQNKIYAKDGRRKIIISTDVAEASITCPTVRIVVDSGKNRRPHFDSETGLTVIKTDDHTKSNWKQRRGRAGRTFAGDAYALFTPAQLTTREEYPRAEILRADLVSLVLRMKTMGIDNVHDFDFIDHPTPESMDAAIETLKKLGALNSEGKIPERVGDQKSIGEEMAELPLDPHFARMLVEAKKRDCVDAVSILVGFLSNRRSVFNFDPRSERFAQKYAPYIVPSSDYLTLLNVWNDYVENNTSKENNREWSRKKGLARGVLYEITKTKNEILSESYLKSAQTDLKNKTVNITDPKLAENIVKCIAAGFTDKLIVQAADRTYRLLQGGNQRIQVTRSSAIETRGGDLVISGDLHTNERTKKTFAGLNQVVTEELLKDVAPYFNLAKALEKTPELSPPLPEKTPLSSEKEKVAEKETLPQEAKKEEQKPPVKPAEVTHATLASHITTATETERKKKKISWIQKIKTFFRDWWKEITDFFSGKKGHKKPGTAKHH